MRVSTLSLSIVAGMPLFSPAALAGRGAPSSDDGPAIILALQGGPSEVRLVPFSADPEPERETIIQQTFWTYHDLRAGVRVASGDVNGDGAADIITGPGPGAGPHVKVFDGRSNQEIKSFFAFDATFTGGINIAAGDVTGDGVDDIVVGAGPGAPGGHVRVFDGTSGAQLQSFLAFPGVSGGVNIAVGDITGDGVEDIVAGTGAGAPGGHVKVFDGQSGAELMSFFAFTPSFSGGVNVAAGDVDGDGLAEIVVGAGPGAGPHVKVFDGSGALLNSFFAFDDPTFTGGVRVCVVDVDSDGDADTVYFPMSGFPANRPNVEARDSLSGAILLSTELFDPTGLGIAGAGHRMPPPAAPCFGDANADRSVNFADITAVLSSWQTPCP